MKKIVALCLLLFGNLAPSAMAMHQDHGFETTIRGIYINPDVDSTLPLDVKTATVPEFDISYFFMKNLAVELILSTARHEIYLAGTLLGKTTLLPPTLTLQYEIDLLEGLLGPYIGVGINYTHFYNVTLPSPVDIERDSWGPAFQLGLDINVTDTAFINLDVKKLLISTDVIVAGATVDELEIDPMIYGIGFGFRF